MIAALLLLTVTAAPRGDVPVIAVFGVRDDRAAGETAPVATLQSMTNYLGVLLTQSQAFRVVPGSDLQSALQQAKRDSYESCYDERCQIEVGKAVAAALSLDTRIGRVGSSCVVTASVYDLREETATRAASARGGCSEDALTNALEELVRQLAGGTAAAVAAGVPLAAEAPVAAAPSPGATRRAFAGTDAEWDARLGLLSSRLEADALQDYLGSGQAYEVWATEYNDAHESLALDIARWTFTGLSLVAVVVAATSSNARDSGGFWLPATGVAFLPALVTWSFDIADIGAVPTSP